ncbi:MAG: 50S ribosomal protein L9, partial [Dehalococcoidia bacterium]
MRVVFLEEVTNVAKAGDVKEVKNGFARNFLFPKNLAVLATPDQMRRVEALKKVSALRQENAGARAEALAPKLEGRTIVITAKSGPSGRLYGSVTPAAVAAELSRTVGQEIGARDLALQEPIKAVGTYQTLVRLAPEVEPTVTIEVVEAEEEMKPTTKRRRKPKPRAKAPAPVVETPEKAEPAEVAAAAAVQEVVGEAAPESAVKTEEEVIAAATESATEAEEPEIAEPEAPAPALEEAIDETPIAEHALEEVAEVAEEPEVAEPEAPAPALEEAIDETPIAEQALEEVTEVAEEPEVAEPEAPAPALEEAIDET